MKEFFAYLLQFGPLTRPQQDLIARHAARVTLRKGDYFAAQQVGFVAAGVLRVGSYTERGEELTSYFIEEQHPLLDIRPLEAVGTPAPCLAQALTDCRLVVFSARQWQTFAPLIPGWEVITQKILAHALRVKMERVLPLVAQDATARYRSFLLTYPHLANRVPLAYVAAYLGMTQSSLSRVRKHM
ncbi:Crp/Fnr family transcriptional regulator [Hymenobacter terricola]|uniref:Crp/Fnr family transcriptional regulator n=1 Tax=Hymenobacter terricola TaxID=2819236 RepID=UPI001B306487|nr:Crp/Fnr family transcriptional regulator [Hymenobacter terricola]